MTSDFKSITFPDGERIEGFSKHDALRGVSTIANIIIPANTCRWVKCRPDSKITCTGSYVIEPSENIKANASRGIVDITSRNSFDFLLYNESNKSVTIKQHTNIGTAKLIQPTDTICYTQNQYFIEENDEVSPTIFYDNKPPGKKEK